MYVVGCFRGETLDFWGVGEYLDPSFPPNLDAIEVDNVVMEVCGHYGLPGFNVTI